MAGRFGNHGQKEMEGLNGVGALRVGSDHGVVVVRVGGR